MIRCSKCNIALKDGDEKEHELKILCEDCYLDAVTPKVGKTYYEHDKAEFMRRLQNSQLVRKQKYH